MKNIEDELKGMQKKDETASEGEQSVKQIMGNYVNLLPVLMGIMNSTYLRAKIVDINFLNSMFSIYELSEFVKSSLGVCYIYYFIE
jgi:hypothetical protein